MYIHGHLPGHGHHFKLVSFNQIELPDVLLYSLSNSCKMLLCWLLVSGRNVVNCLISFGGHIPLSLPLA